MHYGLYLWPLIEGESSHATSGDPLLLAANLGFLVSVCLLAWIFVIKQIRYWQYIVFAVALIGVANTNVFEFVQWFFSGINSFESLLSRFELQFKFLRQTLMLFRNEMFVPVLYFSVMAMSFQDLTAKAD